MIDLMVDGVRIPRIAPGRALRIFARHGVPIRVAAPPPQPEQPSLCTAAEVELLVLRFIDAFNSGDLAGLDEIFAHEPDFEWYSTDAPGERFTSLAKDRPSLVPYFAGLCYRNRSDVIFVWSMGRQ